MQRYLRLSEAKAALERGQQIEQFLGPFMHENKIVLRYAVIQREKAKYVTTVHEVIQPLDPRSFDISKFTPFKSTPPDDFHFDTIEEACSFLEYRNGASWGKFVNQGMINEEFKDFRNGKTSNASF